MGMLEQLVFVFLSEGGYKETAKTFMSECPELEKYRMLGPEERKNACKVCDLTLMEHLQYSIRMKYYQEF